VAHRCSECRYRHPAQPPAHTVLRSFTTRAELVATKAESFATTAELVATKAERFTTKAEWPAEPSRHKGGVDRHEGGAVHHEGGAVRHEGGVGRHEGGVVCHEGRGNRCNDVVQLDVCEQVTTQTVLLVSPLCRVLTDLDWH
jgi:hypothetical protein